MKVPQDDRAPISESILLMKEVMEPSFLSMAKPADQVLREKAVMPTYSAPNVDRNEYRPGILPEDLREERIRR